MTILARLAEKLPKGSVSTAYADRLATSIDLWPKHLIRFYEGKLPELPLGVVWPTSTEDVQTIVLFAREHGIDLLAYGAGSSVVGGATISHANQLIIDFKRMLAVIDISERMATAQTGIMGELWERTLNAHQLTQGHFPSSIYCSTLGGWIAARGAGQMSSKFGKIEDQVLGGVIVLNDGSVFRQPASPIGAHLLEAYIGNEGASGFWTEATVRVQPLSTERFWRAFDFKDLPTALSFSKTLLDSGVVPSVLRIYDPLDSLLHKQTHGAQKPRDKGKSYLAALSAHFPRLLAGIGDFLNASCRCVIGLESTSVELLNFEQQQLLKIAQQFEAKDLGSKPAEHWYKRRYAISYRQSNAYRTDVAVDTMEVACAWENVFAVYQAVRNAAFSCGAMALAHFSHAYIDGMALYFTYAMPVRFSEEGYFKLWSACLTAAIQAGANVSHHHGIGLLKKKFLTEKKIVVQSKLKDFYAASPQMLVRDVETQLNRDGQSLGVVAKLFADDTVLALAKKDLFMRFNPQFRTLESSVAGVDSFVPAPRAAEGGDFTFELLRRDISRLWLRHERLRSVVQSFTGNTLEIVRFSQLLSKDVVGESIVQLLSLGVGQSYLTLYFSSGEKATLEKILVERLNTLEKTEIVLMQPQGEKFSATWEEFFTLLPQGFSGVLFGVNALGVFGVVTKAVSVLQTPRAFQYLPLLDERFFDGKVGSEKSLHSVTLKIAEQNELDNCTYCPKLCRFSCPTAIADGSEALTPRQLMLTVNLHQENKLPLNSDTALRLWSCVDCKSCQSYCDHNNDVALVLQKTRSQLVEQNSAPEYVSKIIESFVRTGFLPDVNPLKLTTAAKNAEHQLFLSCQNTDVQKMTATLNAVEKHLGEVEILNPLCCGQPLWRIGALKQFELHRQRLQQLLRKKIIVDDPGCFYTLKEKVKIKNVTLLSSLIKPVQKSSYVLQKDCASTRWLGCEQGELGCCGGMLLPFYDASLATRVTTQYVEQLKRGSRQNIMTTSPTCLKRMQSVEPNVSLWTEVL